MHYSTGLLGQRSVRLLATLLVVHSLKLASAVSLSVDAPRFLVGGVAVTESAKYPLLAIVRCSDGHLDMNVSEIFVLADSGPLHIQIEENSNNPNEFFILPNHTGAALEDGEYQIEITCHSQSTVSQVAGILVSILTPAFAAENDQPYFTAAPRYVNISSNTSPGTVIATYDAKVSATYIPYIGAGGPSAVVNTVYIKMVYAAVVRVAGLPGLIQTITTFCLLLPLCFATSTCSTVPGWKRSTAYNTAVCCSQGLFGYTIPTGQFIWGTFCERVPAKRGHAVHVRHCDSGRSRPE